MPGSNDLKIQTAVLLVSMVLFSLLLWRSYRNTAHPAKSFPSFIVEVRGDVPSPGIYVLDSGCAKLSDALQAAGWSGVPSEPSRELESGELVSVVKSETGAQVVIGSMSAAARLAVGFKLDLNSASEEDLMLVPQMRPDTIASIMKRREEKPWEKVADLMEIHGIGLKTAQKYEQFLEVKPTGVQ